MQSILADAVSVSEDTKPTDKSSESEVDDGAYDKMSDNALDRNFYTVFDWMVDPAGLGLKASSAELSVYAKITR